MIKLICPHCEKMVGIPSDMLGEKVRCPKCRETFMPEQEADDVDVDERLRSGSRGAPHHGIILILLALFSIGLAFGGALSGFLPCTFIPIAIGTVALLVGVAGWVIGQRDLKGMREGWIDRSGHGMALVGFIGSIIGTVFGILTILVCGLGNCVLGGVLFNLRKR